MPASIQPMCIAEKRNFLHDELFSMTLMATVQRGKVYSMDATDAQKAAFQAALRQRLEAIAASYAAPKSDTEHEENICNLADALSGMAGLRDGRFRIGSAQKALNLWLKYLWCIGELSTPPHCPFDFQIIRLLPNKVRCNWTALDSMDGYRALVTAARQLAGDHSLADWELCEYNES